MEIMDDAGIPAGPVLNHVDVFDNPQTIERGMVETVQSFEGWRHENSWATGQRCQRHRRKLQKVPHYWGNITMKC